MHTCINTYMHTYIIVAVLRCFHKSKIETQTKRRSKRCPERKEGKTKKQNKQHRKENTNKTKAKATNTAYFPQFPSKSFRSYPRLKDPYHCQHPEPDPWGYRIPDYPPVAWLRFVTFDLVYRWLRDPLTSWPVDLLVPLVLCPFSIYLNSLFVFWNLERICLVITEYLVPSGCGRV